MSLGPLEILIILLIVLLLFGASKLPNLARSVGRSARIFKSEINEMKRENETPGTPNGSQESFATKPREIEHNPAKDIANGPVSQNQRDVEPR